MIWSVRQLIAYLSQMTLEPGDVIATGSPAGSAIDRDPGEPSWFLHPGDVVESEVEGIGVLRNRVIERSSKKSSWRW
jgi:2-keto-4-pentenoate hydratase/2-oxohepta-3-ene-1,7-dioic acid hydratase in catechol pathway